MTSHNPSSFSTEKQAKTDFRPKNVCIRAYFLLLKAGRDADAHGNTLQSCFGSLRADPPNEKVNWFID